MKFDEQYFKSLNYTDYLKRGERYLKLAYELNGLLEKLGITNIDASILDYGCAVGFLMEGFHKLGYKKIYGYDISKWASAQAKKKGLNILNSIKNSSFDIIFCLDVLEHMHDDEINRVFAKFKSDIMIVRIPCSIDGKRFVLDVSNQDNTHINLKTKKEWIKLLTGLGYRTLLPLNMLTIYDTQGVMCALCLKRGSYFSQ